MGRRRHVEPFSLSFLDCVCCGFGAIIFLLVLSRIAGPVVLEAMQADPGQILERLPEQAVEVQSEAIALNRKLVSARRLTTHARLTLKRLQLELDAIQGQYEPLAEKAARLRIDEGKLEAARQELTEEMVRLQAGVHRLPDDAVGGIPADSEYIVFVIDTSGSMQVKWRLLEEKLHEVLDAYPAVKGLQIMNDNGRLMFPEHGPTWLEDTPQLRRLIRKRIKTWGPYSDSNPADGILYALETFDDPAGRISIYVFGDDFTGPSMEAAVREIEGVNAEDEEGNVRVRIHAIGFPTDFGGTPRMSQRFAGLMRAVCARNGGTFVGLTTGRTPPGQITNRGAET